MQTSMDRLIHAVAALTFVLMFSLAAFAQEQTPEPQTDNEDVAEATQPDQEVEVNEDNYRQFMELKDGLQQRTIAPEDSYESRSGLQKLDNLPEASQKHLRDQLREVISQGDRWQPGDENTDYPYVPSDAARTNAGLQEQEAEAWGELLDNYHAREAQIYANSARSSAALAGSQAGMGGGDGESGDQAENRSGQGQQGGEKSASQPGSQADSFSPGAQGSTSAQNSEGVAQNAMEFLQNAGYQDGSGQQQAQQGQQGQQEQQGEAGQTGAQAQQPAQSMTAQASQGETTSTNTQNTAANQGAQNVSQTQNPDGSEQNAMQYLQQLGQQQEGAGDSGDQQAGDGSETSSESNQEAMDATDSRTLSIDIGGTTSDADDPEGVSQNALEYLAGEGSSEGDAPADTLSIQDLLNAQGVGGSVDAPQPEEPPKDPPDKPDNGGGG